MTIRSRNHLAKFDTRSFPVVSFVAITKVVRRARAVKHDQLSKLIFMVQHMTQRRTQRRNSGSHRYKNQVASLHFVELETVTRNANKLDLIADAHVIDHAARAYLLLHQHFEIPVVRRTRKSEISRFFTLHSQDRNLSGREINSLTATQIKRPRVASLLPNARNHELSRFFFFHRSQFNKSTFRFSPPWNTIPTHMKRFAPLLLLAFCALSVQAQSGRRQVKPPPVAPVPTPTPEATPVPKKEVKNDLVFFVGADRDSSYASLPFTYYDAVLRGCASRLRAGSSADVEVSDHDVNRGEAIKKAKSETNAYVVWLNLTIDSMARSYDDLVLEFIVYAPETAKIVTNGRSYLTGRRAGPVVVDPTSRRNSGLYREELLKRAGEEAGDRIIKALHLDVQIPH